MDTSDRDLLAAKVQELEQRILNQELSREDKEAYLQDLRQAKIAWLWTYSIFDSSGPRFMANRFKHLPPENQQFRKSFAICPNCDAKPESVNSEDNVLPLVFAPVFERNLDPDDDFSELEHFCSQCAHTWQTRWDDDGVVSFDDILKA